MLHMAVSVRLCMLRVRILPPGSYHQLLAVISDILSLKKDIQLSIFVVALKYGCDVPKVIQV